MAVAVRAGMAILLPSKFIVDALPTGGEGVLNVPVKAFEVTGEQVAVEFDLDIDARSERAIVRLSFCGVNSYVALSEISERSMDSSLC